MSKQPVKSNTEHDYQLDDKFPSFRSELGNRLRETEKRFSNRAEAANAAGVAKSTFQSWVEGKRDPSFEGLSKFSAAAGVSMDWLATGEGEERAVVDPVDARLAEIEAQLNQASVPMSEDDLRSAPKWAEIRDELRLVAKDEKVGNAQRGRADLILRLAFSDQGAAQRDLQRQADVGDRLRRSRQVCDAAVQAVGWEPPRIVWESLRNSVFDYDMRLEDAARLLEAIQIAVEGRD